MPPDGTGGGCGRGATYDRDVTGRRSRGLPATSFALVSVLLASAGHALGHGHALDVSSGMLAVALAAALGLLLADRWTTPRLLVALGAVQLVVHVLGSTGSDSRLVAAATHGHSHGAVSEVAGTASSGSMLLWHVAAVPVAALALAAVRRSAVVVSWLARSWVLALPVVLPAPAARPVPDPRPRVRLVQPHLLVSRSNAPPCPA